MEKYPELDIRVTEMKTQDIQQALHAGDLDAELSPASWRIVF